MNPVTKGNEYMTESIKYTTTEEKPVQTVRPTQDAEYQTSEVLPTVSITQAFNTPTRETPVWQSR